MPTSATGARSAGFTLTEVMVVVVVLGLAAAAVVLTLPDGRGSLRAEAETFAARLTRAREEAVTTNRSVAVEATARGYAFNVRRGEGWTPLPAPFAATEWAEGTTATAEPQALVFDNTGAPDGPFRLVLLRDRARAEVVVDASGGVRIDDAARP